MSNTKHLLLLGAGASYGSEIDKSIVPPLASDLFNELLKIFPELQKIVSTDIAKEYRIDFESGMRALAAQTPHALTTIQRYMGAFFYRYGPTSSSLYSKLAKKIKSTNWSGAVATLNYERMLQLALTRENCTFGYDSTKEGQIEICLPHGSCNLFCESVQGNSRALSMKGMNVTTNGPVKFVNHPDQFWQRIRNDAFPPVMSYFEPNKYTLSGANFIENQRFRLTNLITNAKSIAIVGIQVREQDAHIWDALASTNAPIYYCSGVQGATAYIDWQSRVRNTSKKIDTITGNYWSDDFDAINIHLGLK